MNIDEEGMAELHSPRAGERIKSPRPTGAQELQLATEPVLQDESKIQYQILKSANRGDEAINTNRTLKVVESISGLSFLG